MYGLAITVGTGLTSVGCITDTDALKKMRRDEAPKAGPEFGFGSDGGSEVDVPRLPPEEPVPPALPREPEGDRSLTLVHGVADAEFIYFCLVATDDAGSKAEVYPTPLPRGGLAYGASHVLTEEDSFAFSERTLKVYVIAPQSPLDDSQQCRPLMEAAGFEAPPAMSIRPKSPFSFERRHVSLGASSDDGGTQVDASVDDGGGPPHGDASPAGDAAVATLPPDAGLPIEIPELRGVALVQAPRGVLAKAFSYLLVPSGCIGAETFVHDSQEVLCGPAYSPGQSSVVPVFVQLSRVLDFNTVGLQL